MESEFRLFNPSKSKIDQTIEYCKLVLKDRDASHDLEHAFRVKDHAEEIAKKEGVRDIKDIIMAALLHDVDDNKYLKEIKSVQKFLKFLKLKPERIQKILKLINVCSYTKEIQGRTKAVTIEEKILQDADRLDAMGALGIYRWAVYAGHKNESLGVSINHFYDKLLKLKDMFKTKTGRKMAESKHKIMENYIKQLGRETCM